MAAAWGYLVLVLIASVLLRVGGDRWWPATVVLFSGRWVILLPLIPLSVAAVIWARSALVPIAVATWLALVGFIGMSTGWRRILPHASDYRIRLVTFNAEGGEQIAGMWPAVLANWHADVVLLQECGPELGDAIARTPGWQHHQVRGLCLASRLPVRAVAIMDRSALERVHEDEVAGIGGAGYVARYDIDTPAGLIHVTNMHLETPRKGLEGLVEGAFDLRRLNENTTLREIESDLARRWVDRGGAPVVVAGDFNTPVESRIFARHWGDLTDAFSYAGTGFGMTKYNGWIRVRIDHVLTGDRVTPEGATVGDDLGSDHRPVIVDLAIARP